MAVLYEKKGQEIIITGYEGRISHLQIPESVEGLPVRRIAGSAFARRDDLLSVKLPASLEGMGRFAFYYCRNLEKVVLEDGIRDSFDGVFRLCEKLQEVEVTLSGEHYTVLKELLSDLEGTLRVRLHLPGGDACLVFPGYLMEFQEDTFARVFHSSIAGTGYTCRECVSRTGIDFTGYDHVFDRISRLEGDLAAEIALNRLWLPRGLSRNAQALYEAYIREHNTAAVCLAVRNRREDWLRMLMESGLMKPESAWEGIRVATEQGQPALAALLMKAAGPGKNISQGRRFTL